MGCGSVWSEGVSYGRAGLCELRWRALLIVSYTLLLLRYAKLFTPSPSLSMQFLWPGLNSSGPKDDLLAVLM